MNEGTRWQFTAFIVLLVALHFVLRVGMGLGLLVPDLLVVALLLAARRVRPGPTAGLGLLFGVLDGAVNPPLGPSAVAFTLLGFAASRMRDALAGDSPVTLALYLFAGKWLYDIARYVVVAATTTAGPVSELLLLSPLAALYAAAAGLAAWAAYRAIV
jgi:cell shape-determining protein MreD